MGSTPQVIEGPGERARLSEFLEGYLYGMGEVCHRLFGPAGEEAMYLALGTYFLEHLRTKHGATISGSEPPFLNSSIRPSQHASILCIV